MKQDANLLKDSLAGILRHVLTTLGGYLVGAGVIDASQAETLVGAGLAIGGVVWSLVQKHAAGKKLVAAEKAPSKL